MWRRRRPGVLSRSLLGAPLFLAIGVLVAGSSAASSVLSWKAPFRGSLHQVHDADPGTCASTNFGGLSITLAHGHVIGGASTSSSAACSPGYSPLADVTAAVGLTLPSFTGHSGKFTVLAKWKLDFEVDLSVSGSNCQSGTYAIVSLGFGFIVENVTSASKAGATGHSFLFKLTSGSATHLISQNLTVTLDLIFDSSATYEVVPGVDISLGTDTPIPALPLTSTCAADAKLKAGTTSDLGSLVSVAVF